MDYSRQFFDFSHLRLGLVTMVLGWDLKTKACFVLSGCHPEHFWWDDFSLYVLVGSYTSLALNGCIHSVYLERTSSFTVECSGDTQLLQNSLACFGSLALGLFWFQALEQLWEGEGFVGADVKLLQFRLSNASISSRVILLCTRQSSKQWNSGSCVLSFSFFCMISIM